MSPRRKPPEPWRETLEIENPIAACGGCRFTTALDGTWSVEDGRLVFRAMPDPLARRGPSMDTCCESHHEGAESGVLEFRRVTVGGRPLSDDQFAVLKASAASPETWKDHPDYKESWKP